MLRFLSNDGNETFFAENAPVGTFTATKLAKQFLIKPRRYHRKNLYKLSTNVLWHVDLVSLGQSI